MSDRVELVWYGDDAPWYDHGPSHPLRPARVILTRQLIHDFDIVDGKRTVETPARSATNEELQLVHSEDYIDAVTKAGHGERGPWRLFGFGAGDNPIFPKMHEASARVAGATLVAAEAVLSGRAQHAFNPAGGLHHAMRSQASGFCVYDDPAIAIAWLLDQGVERIAYVDVDVHHGDGPQTIFYREPRVLTISLHQDGTTLFPGTGFVSERGAGDAEGTKVNVPLPPFTRDEQWLSAFREVVPPLVEAWKPQFLVTQLGCDSHATDPLANLMLTTTAYREAAALLHDLAHRCAGGRWLATGGGGYQWASVVPRAWTIYFAEMAGFELPDELPTSFVERAQQEAGNEIPKTLSESPPKGPKVEDGSVQEVVNEVKRELFPAHGLTG
ncbi:MAG TPA: acetoin utilization protein AcuC [Candidatus Sulfotelmatobacter sp.]|nr:acetoin utilization protein AcuC [Candidatus Sulfotelmatobacter sp.]